MVALFSLKFQQIATLTILLTLEYNWHLHIVILLDNSTDCSGLLSFYCLRYGRSMHAL